MSDIRTFIQINYNKKHGKAFGLFHVYFEDLAAVCSTERIRHKRKKADKTKKGIGMRMDEIKVLAVDFGASGGRVMLGIYDGETIKAEELHRFSNDPVILNGTMYWDVLRLFYEIKQGMIKAKAHGKIESIGVDTWGVDFGLLDEKGYLLENPVHYRDARTAGMLEKSFEKISQKDFYEMTGNQFMEINTVFQLLALKEKRAELLDRADCLLLMPDLFNYFLSGVKKSERSIASTTQMSNPYKMGWQKEILQKLEIPENILTEIIPTGTILGPIQESLQEELGVNGMDVIAIAGHDTQCALTAVPAREKDFIFVSCGTWSLFGTELDTPIINKQSETLNVTNEIGTEGKTSFLKNIIGLWLIQESRRQWIREGKEYSFSELEKMAEASEPFYCFIDPDAPEFVPAGNVPERIRKYCERTGQKIPQTEGAIVRCINESLALKYRYSMEEIETCTGKSYQAIHMVGGGCQSHLLCRLTACAAGVKVIAGPIEATVYGNIAIQLMAKGAIPNLEEARKIVAASEKCMVFEPENTDQWSKVYEGYVKNILKK